MTRSAHTPSSQACAPSNQGSHGSGHGNDNGPSNHDGHQAQNCAPPSQSAHDCAPSSPPPPANCAPPQDHAGHSGGNSGNSGGNQGGGNQGGGNQGGGNQSGGNEGGGSQACNTGCDNEHGGSQWGDHGGDAHQGALIAANLDIGHFLDADVSIGSGGHFGGELVHAKFSILATIWVTISSTSRCPDFIDPQRHGGFAQERGLLVASLRGGSPRDWMRETNGGVAEV